MKLFPSLIASRQITATQAVESLQYTADGFHIDIMDGKFVDNMAFSIEEANNIRALCGNVLWTHIKAYDPSRYVQELMIQPHDIISLHYESTSLDELKVLFRQIQNNNAVASCALQPGTPIEVLHELMGYIDHVLIMSVEAGFSGQPFLASTVNRLGQLRTFQKKYKTNMAVGVDGGINMATIQEVLHAKVRDVALGSSIFFGNHPEQKLDQFKLLVADLK